MTGIARCVMVFAVMLAVGCGKSPEAEDVAEVPEPAPEQTAETPKPVEVVCEAEEPEVEQKPAVPEVEEEEEPAEEAPSAELRKPIKNG